MTLEQFLEAMHGTIDLDLNGGFAVWEGDSYWCLFPTFEEAQYLWNWRQQTEK